MRKRWFVVGATLLSASLAGCDSHETGQALPTSRLDTSSSQPSTTGRQFSEAPPVPEPLDASKYIQDPCSSLTEAQQQKFEVTSSRENNNETATNCRWNIRDGSTSAGVSYMTSVENGLSNIYALNDTGHWDKGYFEPTEVDGYPAVYVEIADNRDQGDCGMAIGIRDDLFFDANVRTRAGNDACKAAENIAFAVLQTIKDDA
ncbi:DUF3558 domain-containing protein [Amycolatopsis cihanbeyliensis]|nr:DUF3558 domain-containing protein [Amycolatopsis cihanbeyliensis]